MNRQRTERIRRGGLWWNRDFRLLWSGETISQIGAQIWLMAIPLTAISALHAGPTEVSLLTALQYAPVVLITLFAGVWMDRHRRRPVLVVTNLVRLLLIVLIPMAYLTDMLSLGLLYLVTLVVGLLTAVSDVAYLVYLSSLVPRGQLIEANAKLEGAYSIAEIGGPGMGGVLVQWLTAPVALVANAGTCLFAAVAFLGIRKPEAVPESVNRRDNKRGAIFREIVDGIRAVLRHRILRLLVLQGAVFNLFERIVLTLYLLFGVRELGLDAGHIGLILTTASFGGLIGALVADRAASAIGVGRSIVVSMVISAVGLVVIPLAPPTRSIAIAVLITGFVLHGFGLSVFHVHALSVRIAVAPPELLGRIQATFRLVLYGMVPIGALFAGLFGNLVGIRAAMMLGAVPLLALSIMFWFSALRHADVSAVEPGDDGATASGSREPGKFVGVT
ncbi:MAG: MFS transporter [Micromonosporaceae bacterium]|nr:MFS transporter [Micromonosporaceae bacterium]